MIPESSEILRKNKGELFYEQLKQDNRFRGKTLPAVLVDIANLLNQTPMYMDWDYEKFAVSVVPPVLANQFNVVYEGDKLVAYTSYAMLTHDADKYAMELGWRELKISEWDEGSVIWLVDVAAPFGHGSKAARSLLRSIPQDKIERYKQEQKTEKIYVKYRKLYDKLTTHDKKPRFGVSLLPI